MIPLLDRMADADRIAEWRTTLAILGKPYRAPGPWEGVPAEMQEGYRTRALAVARVILEEPASLDMLKAAGSPVVKAFCMTIEAYDPADTNLAEIFAAMSAARLTDLSPLSPKVVK